MDKAKADTPSSSKKKMRPALSLEANEGQMVSLATDLAREQLLNKTASSQIIVHYLKLGTVKEQIELEKLKKETALLEAKTKALKDTEKLEEIYNQAIDALKVYSGQSKDEDEYEEDY